jgi:hypothetical protein
MTGGNAAYKLLRTLGLILGVLAGLALWGAGTALLVFGLLSPEEGKVVHMAIPLGACMSVLGGVVFGKYVNDF